MSETLQVAIIVASAAILGGKALSIRERGLGVDAEQTKLVRVRLEELQIMKGKLDVFSI